MRSVGFGSVAVSLTVAIVFGGVLYGPPPARPQAPDVLLNVIASGARKLNIAVPDWNVLSGTDPQGLAKRLPEVASRDLTFSALFSVVSGVPAVPNDPRAMREAWNNFAAAGAHAGLQGLLALQGDRAQIEMRLYDLTSPEQRLIVSKKFEIPVAQARRLAHKVADEVVFQFTGDAGVADTKIAYASAGSGTKEIYVMDYDGAGPARLTTNQSINLSPSWSPDTRSIAFTSYAGSGYPYLYRLFPFERRPMQLLAGHSGINTSPAWSPDGRSVALTLSKDGNPEVYVLTLATGALRRLTTWSGIDTEPTWSPTGREIAFVSDRSGPAQIYLMDAEGANVRRLTNSGFNTQPRWSPKGDAIVFTSRQGNHDLWAVSPDSSSLRQLTAGPGDNESASWAPNGRHLVFQSNRSGTFQLFTMLADGTEQLQLSKGPGETTSAAWSPRLP
ncbi:MAG TPA: Tol-Pal system beta propeller repeat protein TolB [Methylomirabilota bacterium]|jgi:TolB protein|nr:Tol-Pal system beta propeller repeat protein TolB [Methylomirabilota bacterium]